jgi:hypothetical protein
MDWKEEVRKRGASFLTTHPLLTVIETVEETERLQRTLFSPERPFRAPILLKHGLLPLALSEEERTIVNLASIIGMTEGV